MHIPQLAIIVATLLVCVGTLTRVLDASKPLWGILPGWLQIALPPASLALPALGVGLAHVANWTDLTVAFVAAVALVAPGMKSHRSSAPLPSNAKSPSVPPLGILMLCLVLGLSGCGLFAAAAPYLAEAAIVISDAVNAVDAAQALLPSLHLSDAEQAKAEAVIAKARQALAAAAKADDGATDLTAEQLDASLADFRAAWADLQQTFAVKRVGATEGAVGLPEPLAMRRVRK